MKTIEELQAMPHDELEAMALGLQQQLEEEKKLTAHLLAKVQKAESKLKHFSNLLKSIVILVE